MTRFRWPVLIALVLGLAVWAALRLGGTPDAATPSSALVREAKPEQILDYARDLKSPLIMVNFWASWCEPCKVEFPHILDLQKEFAGRGLRVIFVSVDDTDGHGAAEAFLKAHNVDGPTFYKGRQSLNFVAQLFPNWSGAVPATILLGPDLKIVDGWEGETSLQEFQQRVQKHLKGT